MAGKRSAVSSLIHSSALQIVGPSRSGANAGRASLKDALRTHVSGEVHTCGLNLGTCLICSHRCGCLLFHSAFRAKRQRGCSSGSAHRPGRDPIRMAPSPGQPQALDRRCHRQHSRNYRRLPVRAGCPQQRSRRPHPKFPADPGDAPDGLRGPDRGREQGRSPEPGGAGWHLWRREAIEEKLQDSGYQRHHRRPDRGHRRNRFPRWRHRDPAVRPAGVATGGRLRRLAQAQPRPPRARHPAASAESRVSQYPDRGR